MVSINKEKMTTTQSALIETLPFLYLYLLVKSVGDRMNRNIPKDDDEVSSLTECPSQLEDKFIDFGVINFVN